MSVYFGHIGYQASSGYLIFFSYVLFFIFVGGDRFGKCFETVVH